MILVKCGGKGQFLLNYNVNFKIPQDAKVLVEIGSQQIKVLSDLWLMRVPTAWSNQGFSFHSSNRVMQVLRNSIKYGTLLSVDCSLLKH